MTVRRKRVTDGITTDVESTINLLTATAKDMPAIRAWLKRAQQHASFDGRVREVEAQCRKVLDVTRASSPYTYASQEWYAEAVLDAIALVRSARDGSPASRDLALSHAVRVGVLAAEAEAKHRWPAVRIGLRRQQKKGQAGKASGTARLAKREPLAAAKAAYLTDNPGAGPAEIARVLFPRFGRVRTDGNRVKAMKALAKRIGRIEN